MLIDYKNDAIKFKVGKFILFFPTNIEFETFNNPKNYYGIVFFFNDKRYEILESKLGVRLLINGQEGEMQDIPFNTGTFKFLPNFVKVKQIEELKLGYV